MLVLQEIVHMLLNFAAALLGTTLLLRVYLSWLRLARHNPLVQFSWALTEWLVKPLRMLLPSKTRLDWPCVIAALIVALVFVALIHAIGLGLAGWSLMLPLMLLQALGLVVHWALYMLILVVSIYAILSLVNPHAPLAPTFELLARPLLAPLRRVLPIIGGFDLSPMLFFLGVMILLTILDSVRL
jgi:YggT family protein